MRSTLFLLFLLVSNTALGQMTDADKKATLAFITSLQDQNSGAYKVDAAAKPSLRATAGAVRALKFLGEPVEKLPSKDKTAAFIKQCQDPMSGGFSEPDGKPDVTITSVGIMAYTTVIPLVPMTPMMENYGRAQGYLKSNAKTFEDVRIGAAALESAGIRHAGFEGDWIKIADAQLNNDGTAGKGDGRARDTASVVAMKLRLGYPVANKPKVIEAILSGQRADGGWGKADAQASDLETTYRVMRALMLLKEKPKDSKVLNAWLAKHRNPDGGYALEPGKPSSMSAVYYVTAITSFQ
jgi:hypothetical protein